MAKFEEVYHELTAMGPVLTADKGVIKYAA